MNAVLLDPPATHRPETPSAEPLTQSEVIARGKEIYETTIKALVEPEHIGKFVLIHTKTGQYELIDTFDEVAPLVHLLPDETESGIPQRYLMRIGYPAAIKRGGGWRRNG